MRFVVANPSYPFGYWTPDGRPRDPIMESMGMDFPERVVARVNRHGGYNFFGEFEDGSERAMRKSNRCYRYAILWSKGNKAGKRDLSDFAGYFTYSNSPRGKREGWNEVLLHVYEVKEV